MLTFALPKRKRREKIKEDIRRLIRANVTQEKQFFENIGNRGGGREVEELLERQANIMHKHFGNHTKVEVPVNFLQ